MVRLGVTQSLPVDRNSVLLLKGEVGGKDGRHFLLGQDLKLPFCVPRGAAFQVVK